ncbi:MAG: LamG-like jellyroll fold domain-containing protein [Pseudomonadota bacterium]
MKSRSGYPSLKRNHGILLNPFRFGASSVDPHRASVVAHLHLNGSDGSTSIVDTTGRSWSASGNAQLDTAQYVFNGSSLLLDGTGDYISTVDAAALRIGGADHTIEARIRLAEVGRVQTISNKRDGAGAEEHSFHVSAGNLLTYSAFSGGSPFITLTAANAFSIDTWYVVSASRVGSNWYIHINGVLEDSDTSAGSASTNTAPLYVGRDGFNSGRDLHGHIQEYRLTNGVGRYNGSSYTPATGPFPTS